MYIPIKNKKTGLWYVLDVTTGEALDKVFEGKREAEALCVELTEIEEAEVDRANKAIDRNEV